MIKLMFNVIRLVLLIYKMLKFIDRFILVLLYKSFKVPGEI